MRRPEPKKNALCHGCWHIKPLLMPVGIIPGWPVVIWHLWCVDCRIQKARYEKANCNQHGALAEAWKFSPHKSMRDGYDEFLLAKE